ncbi:MAG: PKD domain-containing protein [Candidatus Woesearchaeota archaeon]
MNNNVIAVAFILLAFVSLGVNTWFYHASVSDPTGHAAASARACVNKPPIPSFPGCGYGQELTLYHCTVETYEADVPKNRTFIDNSTLFNITQSGVMTFFPSLGQAGNYSIEITVIDDVGCPNSIQSRSFTLHILPYPSNDSLIILDTTDLNVTYKYEPVTFYANYTDTNTNESIEDATCIITYDYHNASTVPMTYNETSELYERHEPSGFLQGTFDYDVHCDGGLAQGYVGQTRNDTFTITNRPPYLFAYFPNLTIQAGRSVSGFDLNDYFKDPDFDFLTFTDTSPTVIDVSITALGVVTITPNPTIQGNYTMRFTADDSFDTAQSNIVTITLLPITFPPPGGGGGGGGGPSGSAPPPEPCIPEWECTEWDACLPTGIQTRTCTDLNQCGTADGRPDLLRDCEYIGTCYDNIKNCHSGLCEIGVDCGGPCEPCPFERVEDEEDEVPPEIDRPSPIEQIPEPVRRASLIGLVIALVAAITTVLLSLYLHENLFRIVGQWAARLIIPPERQLSEHAQYVIAVEVLYQRHKDGMPRKEFIDGIAQRTSEFLAWVLKANTALTFEEINERTTSLSKNQRKTIESYTSMLERAQYRNDTKVANHALLRGARKLAERLHATERYAQVIAEVPGLKRSVKERLLSHLSEALDILIEHDRIHAAKLLIEEADAYAGGIGKGDVVERYEMLKRRVNG